MAEIRIEKRKNNWLPWLLGIIGLVLLAWLLVDLIDKDGEPELATADEVDFPDAHLNDDRRDDDVYNAKVQDYENNYNTYIASIDKFDAEEMDVDHDYCHDAIVALANALESLADKTDLKNDSRVMQKSEMMKTKADQITIDWKSSNHADMIRQAAMAASTMMMEIQSNKFPNFRDEVGEVTEAAQQIDPKVLTLDQKAAIKNFFRTAADALEAMRDANG